MYHDAARLSARMGEALWLLGRPDEGACAWSKLRFAQRR